ncbi:hypothetical protein REPUB_Repub10bG0015500 [Reevesia pubescens]
MGSKQAAVSLLTNLARAALGLGAATSVLNASMYTVDGGERAVIFDRPMGPHTFSSVLGPKDLQMVNLTLRVLSKPKVNKLPEIYQHLGLEYYEKVLPSIERAKDFNIELADVAITHLSYGAEFLRAVEQKQVAQQEAERSKYIVQRAEQERRIEASREIAGTLARSPNVAYLPGGQNMLLALNPSRP